jgi:hypothetical protein
MSVDKQVFAADELKIKFEECSHVRKLNSWVFFASWINLIFGLSLVPISFYINLPYLSIPSIIITCFSVITIVISYKIGKYLEKH